MHRLAHGERRLHHLLRDAAGELVLEEAEALAEQVAVRPPAHQHRIVAEHRLEHEQRLAERDRREADEDERRHAGKLRAVVWTEASSRSARASQSTSVPVNEKKTSSMIDSAAVSTDMIASHGITGRE